MRIAATPKPLLQAIARGDHPTWTLSAQLPVNRPKVLVNTYMFDGRIAYEHSGNAPVYAPNSGGRPCRT